jgi:hypothetical protein
VLWQPLELCVPRRALPQFTDDESRVEECEVIVIVGKKANLRSAFGRELSACFRGSNPDRLGCRNGRLDRSDGPPPHDVAREHQSSVDVCGGAGDVHGVPHLRRGPPRELQPAQLPCSVPRYQLGSELYPLGCPLDGHPLAEQRL